VAIIWLRPHGGKLSAKTIYRKLWSKDLAGSTQHNLATRLRMWSDLYTRNRRSPREVHAWLRAFNKRGAIMLSRGEVPLLQPSSSGPGSRRSG
jgi:hypothetical protein